MSDQKRPDVEETLSRLGVEEIEERLEVSPLFTGGDLQDVHRDSGGWNCCNCKTQPQPPRPENPWPPPPGPGG
ncbi:MAG: hypothetical protein ABIF77_22180 [bacterium]